jgi:hypothetical protein
LESALMRGSYLALLAIAAALSFAPSASAATYSVVACAAAPGGPNHSWVGSTNQPSYLTVATSCPPSGTYSGLTAYDKLASPNSPTGASVTWQFTAPAGTTITALRYSRYLGKDTDNGWQVFGKTAEGQVFDTCDIAIADLSCSTGQPGYSAGTEITVSGLSTGALSFGFMCQPLGGAVTCGNGGTIHHVWALLYSAEVTLSDSSAPTVSNIGGPLFGGGYLTASTFASFDASDNAGVRSGVLYVDGVPEATATYSCDFTYAVPCENKNGAELVLDTRPLADGTHSVRVAARDPAANEAKSSAQTITVDNGAPTPPEGLAVDGGNGWHASNSFAVSWSNPGGQVAPVATAHYEVCASDGMSCQPKQQVAAQDVSHIDGISVASTGEWQLRVWLEDAAGNVDPAQLATATLRYGSAPVTTTPELTPTPTPDAGVVTTADTSTTTTTRPTSSQTTSIRRNPSLRLSSARLGHGRVVVRGRLARGAHVRLSLTLRLSGDRVLRRTVVLHGGRFTVAIRASGVGRLRGSVLARTLGNPKFRAGRATLRVPDPRTPSR